MKLIITLILIIYAILMFFLGCKGSNHNLKKDVVKVRISDDSNITKLKKQLEREDDNLKKKKRVKGKYLLVIKTKSNIKKRNRNKINKDSNETTTNSIPSSIGNFSMKSMIITDGKQDTLGGKMICSKQSILYRMSRTQLISCINRYKSRDFSFWFENYSLMNLEELSSIKHGTITSKCNKQNIGAYIDRTVLKSCLQQSLNKGRYIYRNPSSILIKINFKEGK